MAPASSPFTRPAPDRRFSPRGLELTARVLAGALLAATVTSATEARAQAPQGYPECTKKASKEDVEAAKSTHRAATQYYERADYDKAIQYWGDAYNLDCSANDLLLNIANAYEKKGDRASTVIAIETYLKRTGPNPTLEEKVRNLRAAMSSPPPSPPGPVSPASPPPSTSSGPPPGPVAGPVDARTAITAPPASPDGPRPYGAKPWILVGSGGVLAVIGVILLPVGYGNTGSATNTCPNSMCPNTPAGMSAQSTGNAGRSEIGAGFGLLAVGAVAVAGGLVWQLGYNQPASSSSLSPGSPGSSGSQGAPSSTGDAKKRSLARSLWATPTASKDGAGHTSGFAFGGAF